MLTLLRLVSIRHLLLSPLRSILTVMGIAVGVATLIGIAAINRTVIDAFRSTIDTISGKADLTVSGSGVGFPESMLETVRAIPGVAHASGGVTIIAPVKDAPGESLYVMGVDLLDDGFFRNYEGADRDVSQIADDLEFLNSTDRMLVSEKFCADHGLKTGSTFQLMTPTGAKDFIVHGQLKETGPVKAFGGAVAVMFFGSAQEAFGRGRTYDRIDVGVVDKTKWESVRDAIKAKIGGTYEVDRPERRGQSVELMIRSFQLGLNLGSAVALIVGIFLVYNTVSIGVVQRRREIGTLRALGATKFKIRALFSLEAMVFGLVGSLIGLPMGTFVGKAAIGIISESISAIYVRVNAKDVKIGLSEMAIGVALGVLGSLFAALRPAIVASSIPPVEALRKDLSTGAGGSALRSWPTIAGLVMWALAYPFALIPPPFENAPVGGYLSMFMVLMGSTLLTPALLRFLNGPLAKPGQKLFGIVGRLAADNFSRAPVRSAIPVSALSIGVAMSVAVAGFIGSFQHSAKKWIDQSIPADLFVTSSSKIAGTQNQPMAQELGDEIGKIDGVTQIDKVRLFPHDVLGLRIFIVSVIPEIYEMRGKPDILEGKLPTSEERSRGFVTISENFSVRRNLHAGTKFNVTTPTGDHEYTVGAVMIDYTSDQGTIFMARELFAKQFLDDRVDSFHVYVKDPALIEGVRKSITAQFGKKYDLYVLSNSELHTEALALVDNAFAVTHAMEIVAALLALLGVINTLLAAVLDRTREIGLLRAIGATRGHIVRLFAIEAGIIGIIGGAWGIAIGGALGFIVTKVVNSQSTGWSFPFYYPWSVGIGMLLASSIAAVLSGLYPARKGAGLDVVEALSYE